MSDLLRRRWVAAVLLVLAAGTPVASLAGPPPDADGDGIPDVLDNCSLAPNNFGSPASCDTDQDGFGNVCDADFNEDLTVDGSDFAIWRGDFSTGTGVDSGTGTDMNCDTAVDGADFVSFRSLYLSASAPGPSGLPCAGPLVNGCPNP